MINHNDYRREFQVRSLENQENTDNPMVIEGRAIVYNQERTLFTQDGIEYKEIIDKDALKNCDTRNCFLKWNHSEESFPMARTKVKEGPGSLTLDVNDEGCDIRAVLADTATSRELYELVRSGVIDKMSFAFTIKDETFDKENHTWHIRSIDHLYDVSAVTAPAYDKTSLYARRREDVETLKRKEMEISELAKVETEKALEEAKAKNATLKEKIIEMLNKYSMKGEIKK